MTHRLIMEFDKDGLYDRCEDCGAIFRSAQEALDGPLCPEYQGIDPDLPHRVPSKVEAIRSFRLYKSTPLGVDEWFVNTESETLMEIFGEYPGREDTIWVKTLPQSPCLRQWLKSLRRQARTRASGQQSSGSAPTPVSRTSRRQT